LAQKSKDWDRKPKAADLLTSYLNTSYLTTSYLHFCHFVKIHALAKDLIIVAAK
jgi:hypothetical protein